MGLFGNKKWTPEFIFICDYNASFRINLIEFDTRPHIRRNTKIRLR